MVRIEEMQELCQRARARRPALAGAPLIVVVLQAVGQRREPRDGERVDDRQDEDRGGDEIEGILGRPLHQCGEQPVGRRRRIG